MNAIGIRMAAVAVTACVGATAMAQQAVQWRVEDGGNGHWYALRSSGLLPFDPGNWNSLVSWSQSNGGYLASIEQSGENAFVQSLVSSASPSGDIWCYIGAVHAGGSDCSANTWNWLDSSAWGFTNWQGGQPNCLLTSGVIDEPRLALRSSSGQWGDWSDRELTRAVIEWSADCNSDGVVDFGQILAGELADANGNNIPDCCEIGAADLDGNGGVDGIDLAIILNRWGTDGGKDYPNADIDGNGTIDGADLAQILGSWGNCP